MCCHQELPWIHGNWRGLPWQCVPRYPAVQLHKKPSSSLISIHMPSCRQGLGWHLSFSVEQKCTITVPLLFHISYQSQGILISVIHQMKEQMSILIFSKSLQIYLMKFNLFTSPDYFDFPSFSKISYYFSRAFARFSGNVFLYKRISYFL